MQYRDPGVVGLSVLLSYVVLITIPYLWMAVFAAVPFIALKSWKNAFTGFGIGTLTALSVYLFYPLANISRLSGILGSVAGVPAPLVLILYPLIYGVIFGLSALLWSGLEYRHLLKISGTRRP